MTFSSDLNAFNKKTNNNIEKVLRGTALSLFTQVIIRSPVDTGALRGNWQTNLKKPKTSTIDRLDPAGSSAINEAKSITDRLAVGGNVFMTNNLPYAKIIEEGSSSQAPNGMVRITVLEFRRVINKQLRKVTK